MTLPTQTWPEFIISSLKLRIQAKIVPTHTHTHFTRKCITHCYAKEGSSSPRSSGSVKGQPDSLPLPLSTRCREMKDKSHTEVYGPFWRMDGCTDRWVGGWRLSLVLLRQHHALSIAHCITPSLIQPHAISPCQSPDCFCWVSASPLRKLVSTEHNNNCVLNRNYLGWFVYFWLLSDAKNKEAFIHFFNHFTKCLWKCFFRQNRWFLSTRGFNDSKVVSLFFYSKIQPLDWVAEHMAIKGCRLQVTDLQLQPGSKKKN